MEFIYQSRNPGIFQNIFDTLFDFISPRTCEVCNDYIGNNPRKFEFFCDKCFDKINLAPPPVEIMNKLIGGFPNDELAISNAFSLFSFKENHDFMNLIYSLKYFGAYKIGIELGVQVGRVVELHSNLKYDYIVPVPIHHARLRERGFNQSYYISKGINMILKTKIDNKIITRNKYTQTQTVLEKDKRRTNIIGAISSNKNVYINNKYILMVDDVLTTGSTLNACASKLLEMGAKQVDVATIVNA
jgi:ComF family protein